MKKKKFGFHNFAEHLQKARETPVKNQWCKSSCKEKKKEDITQINSSPVAFQSRKKV